MKGFLIPKQREDIKKSLSQIREDIDGLLNDAKLTDYQLLSFYEELKKKAEFAYMFIKTADIFDNMNRGNKSFTNQ